MCGDQQIGHCVCAWVRWRKIFYGFASYLNRTEAEENFHESTKGKSIGKFCRFPSAYFGVVSDEKFNLLGISPGRKAVKAIKLRFTLTLGEVSVRKPILPAA